MPSISAAFPKQANTYAPLMKATDIKKSPLVLHIKAVVERSIKGENKLIMQFSDHESELVLNATNARTLAEMYGDNTDEWTGKEVTLASVPTEYNGQSVKGIRVL